MFRPWRVIGVAAAILMASTLLLHAYLLDGLDGWFFSTGFEEDTEYAGGYSDDAFRSVRLGMATRDVVALLGPPLETGALGAGRETWRWSRSPGDKSYRVRVVIFDGGRAVEIHNHFDVD